MCRTSFVISIFTLLPGCAQPQQIDLSPRQLQFETVEQGIFPYAQTVTIHTSQAWTLTPDGGVAVDPPKGTGDGTFRVGLRGAATERNAGSYSGSVTVKLADGTAATIPISIKLVKRAPEPKFTYIAGPKDCRKPGDLPDEAICTVPDEKPPGNFTPPPAGQTYTDPNFGAKIRILTNPQTLHGYSTPSAISANNRYALVAAGNDRLIIDLQTGKTKVRRSDQDTPFEGVMWDATRDDFYYFPVDNRVLRYDVAKNKTTVVVDYGKKPYQFKRIVTGSSSDTSKDNWMAFWAPAEAGICALDLNTAKSYCSKYDPQTIGLGVSPENGAAIVSKGIDRDSKKRYVILASNPAAVIYTVNEAAGKLDFEYTGPELPEWSGNSDGKCQQGEHCQSADHWDTGEDSNGIQYLFGAMETVSPCEYSLYSIQLNKGPKGILAVEVGGGRKRLMKLFRCGGEDIWPDYHVGCAKAAPYCVFSTTYGQFQYQRKEGDFRPQRRSAHLSEVLVVRDNGAEVRRLMQHRSVPLQGEEARSYWTTPRACISNDGSLVLLDSNFGEVNRHRVVLVETGFSNK